MRRKATTVLAIVLLLTGVAVMAYPAISNYVNTINGSYVIQNLTNQMENIKKEELEYERRLAKAYNATLKGGDITDVFSVESDSAKLEEYNAILDFNNHVMGYIEIPVIDVKLPIYHGINSIILEKGVGHMPQSAFPIGGEGNHSILTGHTGLPSAELFTDLDKLKEGDLFHINILDEIVTYQVDQVKIVLPEDVEDLQPVAEKDYCTLVTCTPYGINSHRLLVRGTHVETPKNIDRVENLPVELVVVVILFIIGIAVFIIYKRRKIKKMNQNG